MRARRPRGCVESPRPDLPSLAAPAPFSQSPLWGILQDYFTSRGVSAWDEQTPYLITNSAATAQVYAELILALVRDLGPDPEGRPVTILELGTGIGRMGFLLCRELERQRNYFAATRAQPVRLVLSDYAEENVLFWEEHPSLAPYAEAGWLDFARFDPVRDTSVRLRRSGEVIGPGGLALPLVVLANYFFDSLPHDEFLIRSHQLLECRVELFRAREPRFSSHDRPDIRDVTCHRTYRAVSSEYYRNSQWNALLREYLESMTAGAVTVPVGALTSLAKVQALSSAGLMVLASDRAYTTPAAMGAYAQHDYDIHGGGFSSLVNFDALGHYFRAQDGLYLHTSHRSTDGVQTMAGVALPTPRPLENLEFVFREHLERVSRINSASQCLSVVRPDLSSLQEARALVAFLRQNLSDPLAVAYCAPRLLEAAESLPNADRGDLLDLLEEADRSHYPFRGGIKLPHWMAHLYRKLGQHERALDCFDRALAFSGEDAYLHMFRAACLHRLGRHEEARHGHLRAIALDPSVADIELASAV